MTTIEEKKMQLDLSRKIAKELIAKGVKNIDDLSKKDIHKITQENCGDYILSLKELSEANYLQMEKQDEGHKTWNLFFTLLKFDFAFYK